MRKASLAKIVVFFLLPSLALLFFVRAYWDDLAARFPSLQTEGGKPHPAAERISWTFFWGSFGLLFVWIIGHLLSPERAERKHRPPMPALLRDLIRYGLFLLAFAVILKGVWGEDVTPLIGALGIGGIVLGFALQETLSNFFAGLSLLAEKPFGPGDWIRIGDRPEGQVEHVTWRATKLRTRDNDFQIFPNNLVAKEVILNFRQPDERHAIRLAVGTSYTDPPDRVKKTILDILAGSPGVLSEPAPIVYVRNYADFSINYEIKCYIDDYARRPVIEDGVMHRIWYAFRRARIEIPYPTQVQIHREPAPAEGKAEADLGQVIGDVPIFAGLGPEEKEQLIRGASRVDFAAGEPVIRQGQPGNSLYCILSGRVRVAVRSPEGGERTVAQLSPGDVFGEMSLLTGEPRSASVHAEESVVLCKVPKEALLPVLKANPSAAERMAEVMASRRQGLDRAHAEAASEAAGRAQAQGEARSILGKIRSFFGI